MVGKLDHGVFVSLYVPAKFEQITTRNIPNRLADAFEEQGMTIVKIPVMQS